MTEVSEKQMNNGRSYARSTETVNQERKKYAFKATDLDNQSLWFWDAHEQSC